MFNIAPLCNTDINLSCCFISCLFNQSLSLAALARRMTGRSTVTRGRVAGAKRGERITSCYRATVTADGQSSLLACTSQDIRRVLLIAQIKANCRPAMSYLRWCVEPSSAQQPCSETPSPLVHTNRAPSPGSVVPLPRQKSPIM